MLSQTVTLIGSYTHSPIGYPFIEMCKIWRARISIASAGRETH